MSLIFTVVSILDVFKWKSQNFDSIPSGIESILIISYCIFFLFEKIKEPDSLFLYNTPNFWIVVGLILYFAGTFFLYIYSQNNLGNPEYDKTYAFVNSSFSILKNVLFSIAFLVKPQKTDKPDLRYGHRQKLKI
jgi:hypothetical protein